MAYGNKYTGTLATCASATLSLTFARRSTQARFATTCDMTSSARCTTGNQRHLKCFENLFVYNPTTIVGWSTARTIRTAGRGCTRCPTLARTPNSEIACLCVCVRLRSYSVLTMFVRNNTHRNCMHSKESGTMTYRGGDVYQVNARAIYRQTRRYR